LALGMALFFHQSLVARHLESAGYELLRQWLAGPVSPDDCPVVVVDISDVPRVKNGVTDRTPLGQFLDVIGTIKDRAKRPVAIGIDIDFYPHKRGGGFAHENDPEFFDNCLARENREWQGRPRIYLGVAELEAPELWLG